MDPMSKEGRRIEDLLKQLDNLNKCGLNSAIAAVRPCKAKPSQAAHVCALAERVFMHGLQHLRVQLWGVIMVSVVVDSSETGGLGSRCRWCDL